MLPGPRGGEFQLGENKSPLFKKTEKKQKKTRLFLSNFAPNVRLYRTIAQNHPLFLAEIRCSGSRARTIRTNMARGANIFWVLLYKATCAGDFCG
jgi:hypothetical protein